jgi:NhaP-type Na+/H+ or K+/H+ antiporter
VPDTAVLWFLIIGGVLIAMALGGTLVQRLPLTTPLLYLVLGIVLGPVGLGLVRLDLSQQAPLVERIAEVAVLISLFSAGLKLRLPLRHPRWRLPLHLASLSMVLTIALVTAAGVVGLGLPLGAAILLGAILAPTDPVLASDVQVEHAWDRDRLRFSLTGEGGLNDGAAFPFVMLGLGLLGLHDLGAFGWRWLAVDVVWATIAGLLIGWLLGLAVARVVLFLRLTHRHAVGADNFLALGLIALAYGAALWLHAYGFLAVFAAGLALRRIEREATGQEAPAPGTTARGELPRPEVTASPVTANADEPATDPAVAPAHLAEAVLTFSHQIERLAEVAVVVMVGSLLLNAGLPGSALWFVPLLFLVIRPVAVWIGLIGTDASRSQRGLIGWFGIRGIGSLFYLAYAITHGLPSAYADTLTALTLTTVAASIVVHGVSVTPLMHWYARRSRRGRAARLAAGPATD